MTLDFKGSQPVFLIGGGVGPMAGVLLHEKIVRHTANTTADRDHVDIVHFSLVSDLPDRTGFLRGEERDNPGTILAQKMRPMAEALGAAGREWNVVVPCVTFHTPVIFDAFHAEMTRLPGCGRLYNLLVETVAHLQVHPAAPRRIGVLSTKGSHAMGTWREPLRAAGLDVVELSPEDAVWMHDAIYHPAYGLKVRFPPDPRAVDAALQGCALLRAAGAETVVMGCTELSLIATEIEQGAPEGLIPIDPLTVLARLCVQVGRPRTKGGAGAP